MDNNTLPNKKAPSCSQLATRMKFAIGSRFLSPLRPLLNEVNKKRKTGQTGYLRAMSNFLLTSISGEYPVLEINYSLIKLSCGNLCGVRNPIASINQQEIKIAWSNWESHPYNFPDDEAIVVLYSLQKQGYLLYRDAASRIQGEAKISIPLEFRNDQLHVYLILYNKQKKWASDTKYLGLIQL